MEEIKYALKYVLKLRRKSKNQKIERLFAYQAKSLLKPM